MKFYTHYTDSKKREMLIIQQTDWMFMNDKKCGKCIFCHFIVREKVSFDLYYVQVYISHLLSFCENSTNKYMRIKMLEWHLCFFFAEKDAYIQREDVKNTKR